VVHSRAAGGVVLGEPVLVTPEGLAVLDRDTEATELRVPVEQDKPGNRANDVTRDLPVSAGGDRAAHSAVHRSPARTRGDVT
jgi:hypothetical protein